MGGFDPGWISHWVRSRCWSRLALTRRPDEISMTVRLCSSSNSSHRCVSGMGMSWKFRLSCGRALLAGPRSYWQVVVATQEGIGQATQSQKVIQRADQRRGLRRAARSFEIGPVGRDQRFAERPVE
jgi:hypothetical protein